MGGLARPPGGGGGGGEGPLPLKVKVSGLGERPMGTGCVDDKRCMDLRREEAPGWAAGWGWPGEACGEGVEAGAGAGRGL